MTYSLPANTTFLGISLKDYIKSAAAEPAALPAKEQETFFAEEKKVFLEHIRGLEKKLDTLSEQVKTVVTQNASQQAAIEKLETQNLKLVAELQELKDDDDDTN